MLKKAGDRYKHFILDRVVELPEIQCCLQEIIHIPTGATILHIANDDEENVFCLSFQTTPNSSDGVAHILEHTVLCGSEKYPVKDPFFAMSRRSLNTFMNAYTGADFTCYPAATQVAKDFYHLLEVYLDAVFKPQLTELSFMQEGHRVEFVSSGDGLSVLEYKGIVFNEMKGAMSTPESRLNEALDAALFPHLTYGFNSGGNPKVIPQLTYENLIAFHKKHYHPSHCLFYFYGNLPIEGHLDFLEKHALKAIAKQPPHPRFPRQPRLEHKVKKSVAYPYAGSESEESRCLIAFGWLTCSVLEQETLLALQVLCIVLLGTDAAPLKKNLLNSGLCKQVSAELDEDFSEIPFTITLKGCREESEGKLANVTFTTLKELVANGIPNHLIANAIHQIEFQRTEILGNTLPYGLHLFMRSGLLKQHGGHPETALVVHSLFNKLRRKLKDEPEYFAFLLKKYFIENTHFVSVVATPDKELAFREITEERIQLEKRKKALSAQEIEKILKSTEELADYQESQMNADLNVLPKVSLDDVPKRTRDYELKQTKAGNLTVFHHACFTNQIIYASLVFPLPALDESELPLLKLFSFLLPQIGCGGRTYAQNLEYIQANTGGVGVAEAINVQANDFNSLSPYFLLQGKALYRKADKFFTLLGDMATSADFTDYERLKQLIQKHFSGLQYHLTGHAMRYAMTLATRGLTVAARISSAWGGLEYYHFIKALASNLEETLEPLAQKLKEMQERILCLEHPHLVMTADQAMCEQLHQDKIYGLQEIATRPYTSWKGNFPLTAVPSQGRVITSPVAFTSSAFLSIPYTHPDSPALSIAGNLFDHLTLHPAIREQGGAYGSGAFNQSVSGHFIFYAYRDPNISTTLEAFEQSIKKVVQGDFSCSDLEEAKLEMIQNLDTPIAPGSRAAQAYAWLREGRTVDLRQAFRDRLLALGKAEVIAAVEKHIVPKYEKATTVVFAGESLLEKENALLNAKQKVPLKIETI